MSPLVWAEKLVMDTIRLVIMRQFHAEILVEDCFIT